MNSKIGLQPGTLFYTGNRVLNENVEVLNFSYDSEYIKKEKFIFLDELKILNDTTKNTWINIFGIHNIELIKKIGEEFYIDSLILEDIVNNNQRPKIELRENFIFITLKLTYIDQKTSDYEYEQISFILFKNILLSFQESEIDIFKTIANRLETGVGRLRKKNTDYLVYGLMDRIVDNYFIVIDDLENRLEELEAKIIFNPNKKKFDDILNLKKDILKFKKSVVPLKEISLKLKDSELKDFISEDTDIFFKDLQDHILSVNEAVDSLFSKSNDLLQLYHSTVSTGMNEIMKVLTMISTVFIPLSFLVGLYGMNFEVIPELKWKYGYFILLGIMFSIVSGIALFFKKKKWW